METEISPSTQPTEQALRASMSLLPVGLLTIDPQGTVVMAEGGVFARLGVDAHAMIGQSLFDEVPELPWLERAAQAALSGQIGTGTGRQDGASFEVLFRPVEGPRGEIVWAVGAIGESTFFAQQHLDEMRAEFEELANGAEGVFWEADPTTLRFQHVSRKAEELLGFPRSTWMAPHFWENRLHPEDREQIVNECAEAVRKQRSHQLEYRMLAADGRVVWVRDFVVVSMEDARPARLRGVMQDITELKRAEEERRLLLEKERKAKETAEDALRRSEFLSEASRKLTASLDYETTIRTITRVAIPAFTDGAVVFLLENGRFKQVSGAHADPEIDAKMAELFAKYPPDPERPVGMGYAVQTGQSFLFQNVPHSLLEKIARSPEHLRLLESLRMRSYLGVPLVTHGEVLGVLALATVQRKFEPADLKLAEELGRRCAAAVENARLFEKSQKAIRLRDDFLAVASHELRTPLTPLKILLDLAEKRVQRTDGNPIELIRRAKKSVDRLSGLVGDLLDVAQLEAGRLVLRPETFSLSETLNELVLDFRDSHPEHLWCVDALESDVNIRGDRPRIAQVITNLLDNAGKYSPNGGKIHVRLWTEGDEARFSVTDSGVGIPKEQQAKIFERFVRASTAPITRYGGLGLGLYISRTVIERHGGRIWVSSEVGKGSTFCVALPRICEGSGEDR